jgi:hypothetical protein
MITATSTSSASVSAKVTATRTATQTMSQSPINGKPLLSRLVLPCESILPSKISPSPPFFFFSRLTVVQRKPASIELSVKLVDDKAVKKRTL